MRLKVSADGYRTVPEGLERHHADTRIDKSSAGERKRVSMVWSR